MKPTFNLDKSYWDFIDKEGNCFIMYWAHLRFSLITINYSTVIYSDTEDISTEKSSFKKIPKPSINDRMYFNNPSLQIEGHWEKMDAPVDIVLYTDKKGRKIYWNCHHPKAQATVFYNSRNYQGLGYAENLILQIKPWKLPIDELRWGRFLSEKTTIIWIYWKGAFPINKLIFNGVVYEDAQFEYDHISFDDGSLHLHFQEISTLREGKLSNLLTKMPWLKLIFNNRILNTTEYKYKAKSLFTKDSVELGKGWTLFEIVTWKK